MKVRATLSLITALSLSCPLYARKPSPEHTEHKPAHFTYEHWGSHFLIERLTFIKRGYAPSLASMHELLFAMRCFPVINHRFSAHSRLALPRHFPNYFTLNQQEPKMKLSHETIFKEMEKAIEAIKQGDIVILYDTNERKHRGELILAGCFATPEKVHFCIREGGGVLCLSMSEQVADRIGVERQKSNNTNNFQFPYGTPISLAGESLGVSAHGRCATITKACDPKATANDFSYPGHVPTLIAHKEGLQGRKGQTEAILELIKLAGLKCPGVLCEVLNSRGETASFPELKQLSRKFGLPLICKSWLMGYLQDALS